MEKNVMKEEIKITEKKDKEIVSIKTVKTVNNEYWHCPIIEVSPLINGLIPTLYNYDESSIMDLPSCEVSFSKTTTKFGQTIYKANVSIFGAFNEEFSNSVRSNSSQISLDEITYDIIAKSRCIPFSKYNAFKINCKYRLSVGVSKDNKHFMLLELVPCRKDKLAHSVISKFVSTRRRAQFELNPSWFEGSNSIKVYSRGDKVDEDITFDDDNFEF